MKKFLLFFMLPLSVSGQWTNNTAINSAVCTTTGDQNDVRLISDGMGGAILVWTDARPIGNTDIYAQRIDSSGIPKWTPNGVIICDDATDQLVPVIVEDGTGGAVIAWKDLRNGSSDIYAQRINSSGIAQWAVNGIVVDNKSASQIDPKMISDGASGAILAWQDSAGGTWDIYAQRINSSGSSLWSAGGVAVCTAANDQKNPKIISDGIGELLITWQDKRNGNDYDIYAQKVNASGVPQWMANGVTVCSALGTQNNPKIESDGANGAIIGWADKRNGSDYNIYAQRLDASGTLLWAANGVPISMEVGNQSALDISTLDISGAIFTWKDYRNNIYADIYAQYINLSGVVQWATNGIAVSIKTFDQINPNIVTDATGGMIVWQDSSSGSWDVYAQKVLLNGTMQWGTNGKILGNALYYQTGPKQISDGKDGFIVVWQDSRDTANKYDLYAQNIHSDGTLGNFVGMNEFQVSGYKLQVYPNPNNGKFDLQITNGEWENGKIEIYNLIGECIFQTEFKNLISQIDLSGRTKGIYFYRIKSGENSTKTGKIVIQ